MTAPGGLGWWVAFERAIDDGPKAADLAKALAVCEATGATWVCLRAGDGGHADADLTEASILAFKTAGLKVYLWPFVYGHDHAGTIAICKRWRGLCLPGGAPAVDGIIINAEYDFMASATPEQARELVRGIRAAGYNFVGHAPPDYAGGRGEGPLDALDATCDATFPQVYGYEHDDRGHVHHIDAVRALYAKRGIDLRSVQPILCSYRPRVRGYDANKKPIPTLPMPDEAGTVARDVVAALDHCAELGCWAPSIYTIDALHFASRPGVGQAVLDALAARVKPTRQTAPDGALQLADTDRAPATSIADEAHSLMALLDTDSDEPDTTPQTPTSKSTPRFVAVRPPPPGSDPDATWPADGTEPPKGAA